MIGIVPMDITDDETIKEIIAHIDTILQVTKFFFFIFTIHSMTNMLVPEINITICWKKAKEEVMKIISWMITCKTAFVMLFLLSKKKVKEKVYVTNLCLFLYPYL